MAKNPRRQQKELSPSQPKTSLSAPAVSRRGKRVIGIGIAIVAIGFWILSYTDPAGQNWASKLSPAILVAGYALIGIGIMLPDPTPESSANQSSQ
jgi:dipeptide/tripeptide permease